MHKRQSFEQLLIHPTPFKGNLIFLWNLGANALKISRVSVFLVHPKDWFCYKENENLGAASTEWALHHNSLSHSFYQGQQLRAALEVKGFIIVILIWRATMGEILKMFRKWGAPKKPLALTDIIWRWGERYLEFFPLFHPGSSMGCWFAAADGAL